MTEAKILPFTPRKTQEIDGQQIDLGRATLLELQVLEQQCSERFAQAHRELKSVRAVLEDRFPGGVVS